MDWAALMSMLVNTCRTWLRSAVIWGREDGKDLVMDDFRNIGWWLRKDNVSSTSWLRLTLVNWGGVGRAKLSRPRMVSEIR